MPRSIKIPTILFFIMTISATAAVGVAGWAVARNVDQGERIAKLEAKDEGHDKVLAIIRSDVKHTRGRVEKLYDRIITKNGGH